MMESRQSPPLRGDLHRDCAAFLEQRYDEVKGGTQSYALVQLNIKNFRYFNTKYGQEGGDEILSLVLGCLQSHLQEGEYAAHLYADFFGMLLRYEDSHALVYERMMDFIYHLYRIDDSRLYRNWGSSMGIYQITDPAVTFDEAINYANLSRRESDGIGNRSYCMELYDQTYYDRYMERIAMEEATADAYKNYEFITFLQPKIDLRTGRIAGAEALLRWFDKEGNSIPLYRFLPTLNRNSYIVLVDEDIFDQTMKWMDARLKLGKPMVPISFNISKAAFEIPDTVQKYIAIFEKYNIPKHLVEIEFMESISLDDTARMKQVVSAFREYGFSCALDDFGNGYSSFNVLLNASLDVVKMDRQFFVTNLNGDSELIIRTIVDLIHSLNMKVVAEGVDNQAHIDYLKQCGCDFVQGFYYHKPMPVDDFEQLLDTQTQ